jgi:hypothetical protein
MDEASLVALHSKLKSSGPAGGRGGLGAGGAAPRLVAADAAAPPRSALCWSALSLSPLLQ